MLNDKTLAIICLGLLAVAEFVYCQQSGHVPQHTGTIVGAVAGFVTGSALVR